MNIIKAYFLAIIIFPSIIVAQQYYAYSLSMTSPNNLVVFSGSSTGLTQVASVLTGSNGLPVAGPALQSQGAIAIAGSYLFAVNPTDSTVSMFSIVSPSAPTLIATTPSGGNWPVSVCANQNTVCVVNSGVINGIQCFSYSAAGFAALGNFIPLGLTLKTPPATGTGPAQISFTFDNMGVVVTNKGGTPPIFVFELASGVVIGNVTATKLGKIPSGFVFDTDGTMVLTDDPPTGGGIELLTVNDAVLPPTIAYLLPVYFLIGANGTSYISRSPSIGHFYVANTLAFSVTEISRSGTTLTVVNSYPLTGLQPIDNTVVTLNGQDFLLQLSANQQIDVLQLVAGTATVIQTVAINGVAFPAGLATYVVQTFPSATHLASSIVTSVPASASIVVFGFMQLIVLFVLLI